MTQKDKELLLKDLCARLPYKVIVNIEYSKEHGSSYRLRVCSEGDLKLNTDLLGLFIQEEIYLKPYLRPMSSMTEEEKRQYMGFIAYSGNPNGSANFVDWLNAHHFDYRTTYDESKEKWVSMIEKGLAIAVTEENNPYAE